jgi:hypothetical protein
MLYQLAGQTERQKHIEQAAKGKYINGSVAPYRMIVQGVMPDTQIKLPRITALIPDKEFVAIFMP